MQVGGDVIVSFAVARTHAGFAYGVPLVDFFEIAGLPNASTYTFVAADGYRVTVGAEELAGGMVFIDNDGLVVVGIADTAIQGLLYIRAD